jgi:hypothetical protein
MALSEVALSEVAGAGVQGHAAMVSESLRMLEKQEKA